MRELNRVHLGGLRAVEASGRLGSLQAAAGELGVTIGAVSQQVIKTERQLGRAVFRRTARGLVPTPFGTELLRRLEAGFRVIDEALIAARERPADRLAISVAPVFAAKWLVPRLGRFSARHDKLRVLIDATVELVDPAVSDIDLAIRVGDGDWPDVRREFLLPQEVFPVCAPELAARLARPADLLALPVVRDLHSNLSWQTWLAHFGLSEDAMRPGNGFTDAALALDAAIAGQGVMLAWHTLAHDALASGRLVAPFDHRAATGLGYWMITARDRPDDHRIVAFKAWLRAEIAETAAFLSTSGGGSIRPAALPERM